MSLVFIQYGHQSFYVLYCSFLCPMLNEILQMNKRYSEISFQKLIQKLVEKKLKGYDDAKRNDNYHSCYIVWFQVENSIATYEPHACIVVYSVVSKGSFKVAEEILNYLWQENYTREKTVIVVGNKADLMRARCITTEGKNLW